MLFAIKKTYNHKSEVPYVARRMRVGARPTQYFIIRYLLGSISLFISKKREGWFRRSRARVYSRR